jgi:hypothetical protein
MARNGALSVGFGGSMFTGKDILALGFEPGPHIGKMIEAANAASVLDKEALKHLAPPKPLPLRSGSFELLAEATNDDERANLAAVSATMAELVKTPVVRAASAMPDTCPAGSLGDFEQETAGIDCRFYSGVPDLSELPSGYKNAAEVRRQIDRFGLAEGVDEVLPYGCIMGGEFERKW